jgi:hypothetical protein
MLYQDGRKRVLKAVYEDGMTWKVKPAKKKKRKKEKTETKEYCPGLQEERRL